MRVRDLITQTTQILREKNIEEPLVEANLLVAHCLSFDRASLFMNYDKELTDVQIQSVLGLVKRRVNYEPVAYLTGTVNFMGIEFLIKEPVFIPRPETEVLVETLIELVKSRGEHMGSSLQIFDIGTGCGAIGIALLKFLPFAIVYATDVIDLGLARQNAIKNGVQGRVNFIRGNLFEPFKYCGVGQGSHTYPGLSVRGADFIVSNPPYIPTAQISTLQPEIRLFEAHSSIDGGEDGLFFTRKLIREARDYLKPTGVLLLELSPEQEDKVREEAMQYFRSADFIKDFSGNTRVLVASNCV